MKDRISTYPGRVKMTPVSGQTNVYTMERVDQPSQAGTPLNKNTFLKDATAALFGLTDSAVPDDVLSMIGSHYGRIVTGSYTGTGTYGSSNKNSLTFPFVPKLVFICYPNESGRLNGYLPWVYDATSCPSLTYYSSSEIYSVKVNVEWGQTLRWYSTAGALEQLNYSGRTYYYIAVGDQT